MWLNTLSQGPLQLAAVGPSSFGARVPQEIWTRGSVLLRQVVIDLGGAVSTTPARGMKGWMVYA